MVLTSTSSRTAAYFQRSCTRHLAVRVFSTNVLDSDVVIVGGGPAGLALASALGSSQNISKNVSVTLVEGGDLSKVKSWNPATENFSNRVVSLTNTSQQFLKDTGAWNFIDQSRTCAVEQMQIWDGLSDARIEFFAEDLGHEIYKAGMSRLTENFNLQRALLKHVEKLPSVTLLDKTRVLSIQKDDNEKGSWPIVKLDNNQAIRARLLVGADGFNSPVRAYAEIPSFGWSYDTQAIVATMNHPPRGAYEGPNTTAYQRFLPTGPIAFLPLSPRTSSLVWSTKPALATALLSSGPEVLSAMINASFRLPDVSIKYLNSRILEEHTAGHPITPEKIREEIRWRESVHGFDQNSIYASANIQSNLGIALMDSETLPPLVASIQTGSPASFPLRFNHAETYLGEDSNARVVLVGDAAHTMHPLAGQGLNTGLGDVECLSKCIEHSLASGGDIGSYTALLPYAQERYLANHILMASVDKLHKIYTTEAQPLVWARSTGVEILNELDTVKSALMMSAGAQIGPKMDASATGWTLAGNTVQTLASVSKTVGMVGNVVGNMIGSAIKNVASRGGR